MQLKQLLSDMWDVIGVLPLTSNKQNVKTIIDFVQIVNLDAGEDLGAEFLYLQAMCGNGLMAECVSYIDNELANKNKQQQLLFLAFKLLTLWHMNDERRFELIKDLADKLTFVEPDSMEEVVQFFVVQLAFFEATDQYLNQQEI